MFIYFCHVYADKISGSLCVCVFTVIYVLRRILGELTFGNVTCHKLVRLHARRSYNWVCVVG